MKKVSKKLTTGGAMQTMNALYRDFTSGEIL